VLGSAAPLVAEEGPPAIKTTPPRADKETSVPQPEAPKPAEAKPEAPADAPAEPEPKKATTRPGHISMDFVAADLVDVVKAISLQSGIDVVVAGDVGKPITAHLTNKPLEVALELIAHANELAFRKVEGTYVIGTADAIAESFPLTGTTELVTLTRAPANLIEAIVKAAQPKLAAVPHPEGKSVALTGDDESLAAAKALIEKIEAALPEPEPEVPEKQPEPVRIVAAQKVEHVSLPVAVAFLERLGIGVDVAAEEQLGALTLRGTAELVEQARGILEEIDVEPKPEPEPEKPKEREYVTSVRVSYASPQDVASALEIRFGEELTAIALGGTRHVLVKAPQFLVEEAKLYARRLDEPPLQVTVDVALVSYVDGLPAQLKSEFVDSAPATDPRIPPSGPAGISSLPLSQIARMAEADERATVISRSQLTTAEGKAAVLSLGERQVLQRPSADRPERSRFTSGLELQVTPVVDMSSLITLDVSATLSTVSGHTPDKRPLLATREAQMSLRLRHGQTALIGGVLTRREVQKLATVPGLVDMPFFGFYPPKHQTVTEESEIVLLVSPRVVRVR